MPAIAPLHDVERAGLNLPRTINNHVDDLRRKNRLVLLSNHVRGGNVAPGGVRLGA